MATLATRKTTAFNGAFFKEVWKLYLSSILSDSVSSSIRKLSYITQRRV